MKDKTNDGFLEVWTPPNLTIRNLPVGTPVGYQGNPNNWRVAANEPLTLPIDGILFKDDPRTQVRLGG